MSNLSHGLAKLDKRILGKYPKLEDVFNEKGRLGPVRVVRKSLKEIEKVLKALPTDYFNFKQYV